VRRLWLSALCPAAAAAAAGYPPAAGSSLHLAAPANSKGFSTDRREFCALFTGFPFYFAGTALKMYEDSRYFCMTFRAEGLQGIFSKKFSQGI